MERNLGKEVMSGGAHLFTACLSDDSSLGRSQKVQELADLCIYGRVECFEGFDLGREVQSLFKEQRLVGGFECPNIFRSKAAALQADEVQSANLGRISIRDSEGGNILHDFSATSDHGVSAYPAELMDSCHPGEDDVVLNFYVASQSGSIRENTVISHNRIVCDVSIGKKVIVGADLCG